MWGYSLSIFVVRMICTTVRVAAPMPTTSPTMKNSGAVTVDPQAGEGTERNGHGHLDADGGVAPC